MSFRCLLLLLLAASPNLFAAGNTVDGPDANLIYDFETGGVWVDASVINVHSFVFRNDENSFRTENFIPGEGNASNSPGPFIDVGTNTDNTPMQLGQTDPLNTGLFEVTYIGDIFPSGITNADALSEYLTLAEYGGIPRTGTFDLIVVPESASWWPLAAGLAWAWWRHRRRSCRDR